VKRRTLIWVAALNFAVAGAACSSARGDESAAGNDANSSGDTVTIAGCLSAGQDGRFALTAAPGAAVATTARAMDDERDTHSYVLIGGDNLQAHLGKRVEVQGTLSGRQREIEHEAKSKSESPTGTSGQRDTPTVETKEEVDLEFQQLNVRDVRELAPTCQLNP
jgi:hypothetical protein